jgi:hypothetical protein
MRRHLYLNELMSDVMLSVHDQLLPAHRLILAVCPRFAELLDVQQPAAMAGGGPLTAGGPVVGCGATGAGTVGGLASQGGGHSRKLRLHVQDLYPDVLRLLLQHLYGCLERVDVAEAPSLFSACCRWRGTSMRVPNLWVCRQTWRHARHCSEPPHQRTTQPLPAVRTA